MQLPTPNLDDYRFQQIVDYAKRLIPQYCPEWTDHNVSDPGVTLIELFAWMTDMLLYRVNQIPDKMYVTFLELIGVQLNAPRAAHAPITFYLSAPQLIDVTIPAETEVATVRTETAAPIIFTTEADLTIRPPGKTRAFTRSAQSRGAGGWIEHDLGLLNVSNQSISMFAPPSVRPVPRDAFYLALEKNHSQHVMALLFDCEMAGGAGVDPRTPPFEWQAWSGSLAGWKPCEVEHDYTLAFNQPGEVILHLPDMASDEMQGVTAYWLRCRLMEAQNGPKSYQVSPKIERITLESRGGTTSTRHAVTVVDEILGRSEGTPGQEFRLRNTPLLARDATRDYLVIEPPNGEPEQWQEVTDFADSDETDQHFTLDGLNGVLTLGPMLIQPDGTVYRFGAVPDQGSLLRFTRYQYGGGVIGNIPSNTLSVLKTSIPYVARVNNRKPSQGGRNAETLDEAKLRAPQMLRTRTRAVTADDYAYLASQGADVARAWCLAPEEQPGDPADPQPGQVFVLVIPRIDVTQGYILPDLLRLSAELRSGVLGYLNERCPVGTRLQVQEPQYTFVSVTAELLLSDRSERTTETEVRRQAEADLYRYLNPYVGGPQHAGWPFGRALHVSEIYGVLQRIPGVESVGDVKISIAEFGNTGTPYTNPRLSISRRGVICSGQHRITVGKVGREA